VSAERILEVVRLLEEHRRIPLYRLAKMLHTDPDTLRTQIEAFNDVEISGLVLDAAFSIEPVDGWPEDGPDPEPTITDVVKFGPGMGGDSLGLRHQDAAVLGPLLSAAQQLRALEPSNLDLASAVDKLASSLLGTVTAQAGYRARIAALFNEAAATGHRMRITYSNTWIPKVVTRTIEPYRVMSTSRGYEVDAGPLDAKGKPRTFLISQVRDWEVLPATFTRPAGVTAALEANREQVAVTGYAPHDGLWAVFHWAERVDQGDSDGYGVMFTAWLLPPLPQRIGLMMLLAGPDAYLDDPDQDGYRAALARELLEHHGLQPAASRALPMGT
jgi:proteasome accessory factor C